jgi:tetratricopeptide (TPR) repeat protein
MDMPEGEKEILAGERKLAEMDFPAAISKFRRAIKLNPSAAPAFFGKAEAALGIPKVAVEEIIADYQKAIELDPGNPFYRARLGSFCLEVGQWELAEESYTQAAEADPDNAYLYFSEFGLEYYYSWLANNEDEVTEDDREGVIRKSLGYMLRSLDIDEGEAKRLLG